MNKVVWFLLFSWLFPGVDGDDESLPEDPPADKPPGEDDASPPGDGEDEDDLPDPEEIAASRAARRQTQTPALNAEAIAAEAAARAVAAVRQPPQPAVDPEFAREQALLDNPETNDWVKWSIHQGRQTRQANANAQAALRAATDAADKSAFMAKYASNPKIAGYLPKVEEELKKMNTAGGAPPREEVLDWVLGKAYRTAMESGKVRRSKPEAATAAGARVDRGRPAGVRSDVGRSNQNERNRLRERLKDVPL